MEREPFGPPQGDRAASSRWGLLRRELSRQRLLTDAVRIACTPGDVADRLQRLVETLVPSVADHAVVLQLEGDVLRVAAVAGSGVEVPEQVPLEHSPLGAVASTGQPLRYRHGGEGSQADGLLRSLGAVEAIATQLAFEGERLGVLLLTASTHERGLSEGDREFAFALSQVVAPILHLTELLAAQRERTAHLQRALDSRVVIEQAKGILAEREGVRPDDAFNLLRRTARNSRRRIRDLAEQVVRSAARG